MTRENIIFIISSLIAIIQMTSSASIDQTSPTTAPQSNALFSADLIRRIATSRTTENVILSPVSIQTALAMVYMGAAGNTSKELEKGLRLPSKDKDQVGQYFSQLLNKNSGEAELNIANRLFVNSEYSINADFNKHAENYFKSGAEALDFKNLPSEAIQVINTWIENKTNNKISNLMKSGSVDSDTIAVIANAIYFKGAWQEPFYEEATRKAPFWITKDKSVHVDTMFEMDRPVKCAEFPDLQASAIQLPYENSDIYMMLILPSEKDGLANLENKLSSMSLNELSSKMFMDKVTLKIPKFEIDFSTGLSSVLKEMGICSMFEKADLPGIFESGPNVKISDVQHKAYIKVNEAGSESAAASFIRISTMSAGYKVFDADRPFFFAIKDENNVYFVGHVAKF